MTEQEKNNTALSSNETAFEESTNQPSDTEAIEEAEPEVDFDVAFSEATHPQRMKMIQTITLPQARTIFHEKPELPEGYRRLINNKFEDLLGVCFPDHYYFYKKHNGSYYLEEIFHELERIKEKLEEKSTETPARKSLRDTLDPDDFDLLIRFVDAVAANDFSMIKKDVHRIKTYLFNDWLEILRFAQVYALDFLKTLYENIKENRIDPKALREWTIISDDIESLRKGWEEKHTDQNNINWLRFFDEEIKDILRYGTTGSFFELLSYVAENRVNVVRHGPYLEDLLKTIIDLKRPNLFRKLIAQYKISRFDWVSLVIPAANTGQIALIEYLIALEEKKKQFDKKELRFSVMEAAVRNGHFEAFIYFFEQCSEEELRENTQWPQAIMSAINWGDFHLFRYLIDQPHFVLDNIRPEIGYNETKDDDKIKDSLKKLTPHERLIQKTLASDVDGKGSFLITRFLLERHLKSLDVETFLNFKSEEVDFSKTMYLYTFVGRSKQYLTFPESFLSTDTNIRRFFFCFHFTAEILDINFMPLVRKIHDSTYQTDKDAVSLFLELCSYAKYFSETNSLSSALYKLFEDSSKSEKIDKAHQTVFKNVIHDLDKDNLGEPEEMFREMKQGIYDSGKTVTEDSQLSKMIRVIAAKLGERLVSTDMFNKRVKK